MATVERAIEIARFHHRDQKDKAGNDYIAHPLYVMERFALDDVVCRIVGVLHDVPEDTEMTVDDLRREGFSEEIIEALDAITIRPCETLDDYIQRVKKNAIATRVKIEDVRHNLIRSIEAARDASQDKEQREMYGRMAKRYIKTFKFLLEPFDERSSYGQEALDAERVCQTL
ncbi:MAG: GTP pyrophosphokinase [Nitrospirota bacterium]